MIENTTIIKAVGGLTAVGGSVGGGYYVYANDLFNLSSETNYLVQQTTTTLSSDKALYKDVAGSNPVKKEKEFKCQSLVDTKQEDNDCEIYELNVDSAKKYIGLNDMHDVAKNPLIQVASKLTQNSYFRLKINNKKISSEFKYDGSALIKIIKKSDSSEYVQLKILAKINKNSVASSNTMVLAMATKTGKDETINGDETKCNLGGKTDEVNCKIYSLAESFSMSKIDFSTTTAVTNLNTTNDKKYFLIDFSTATDEQKKLLISDDLNTIKAFKNKVDTPYSKFSLESLIVGNITDSDKKIFLLK